MSSFSKTFLLLTISCISNLLKLSSYSRQLVRLLPSPLHSPCPYKLTSSVLFFHMLFIKISRLPLKCISLLKEHILSSIIIKEHGHWRGFIIANENIKYNVKCPQSASLKRLRNLCTYSRRNLVVSDEKSSSLIINQSLCHMF